MPRISVIIPAYQHADCIVETVESVLAQTFRDFEVIIINDGCTDRTEELLQPYIVKQLVRYFKQENRGISATRNRGLSLATGEFVAFLDDDDLWPVDKLEWQHECLSNSDAVVIGGLTRVFGKSSGRKPVVEAPGYAVLSTVVLFGGNPFGSPGQTLIRKSALTSIGGFDPEIWGADDHDMWIRLSRIGEVRRYDRIALLYRVHDANASLDFARMFENAEKVIRKNLVGETGAERARLEKAGFRFLFRYGGKKLIWRGFRLISQGRLGEGWQLVRRSLRTFLPQVKGDPLLLLQIFAALIKAPWKMRKFE